jgi:signal transduction histidine kinase
MVVSVTDCGLGIPEKERLKIFDKFHRVDNRDAKDAYGYGGRDHALAFPSPWPGR